MKARHVLLTGAGKNSLVQCYGTGYISKGIHVYHECEDDKGGRGM